MLEPVTYSLLRKIIRSLGFGGQVHADTYFRYTRMCSHCTLYRMHTYNKTLKCKPLKSY